MPTSSSYTQEESGDTLPSSLSSTHFILVRTDAIITACDPMQNPAQIWMFYTPCQIRLTWTKFDSDDPT